jgi:hypoxanthine-guanine phosphoribosyltransferase
MNKEIGPPNNGRPEYTFLASLEVPPKVPIVINDIMKNQLRPGMSYRDIDCAINTFFASSYLNQPVYFSIEQLVEPMAQLFQKISSTFDERTTAVIFPGNGAQPLYKDIWKPNFLFGYANRNVFSDTDVWVQRRFENGKPKNVTVELSKGIRDAFDWPNYETVVVVDDVIASGMTLNAIKKRLEYAPYRKYNFVGISWFCRDPTAVEGYKNIYSVIQYKSTEGYPALNSISTLLRNDKKGGEVREAYKKKPWIKYSYGFDKGIDVIRNLTTFGGPL